MTWIPTDREIAAVLRLDGPSRYSYWLKKVADQQLVWSLWHAGAWALAGDDQGRQLVPVWPHEKFAGLCARNAWAEHAPKAIEMDAWMRRWIPGMQQDARMVAVFPTSNGRGVVVDPARLHDDLQEELSNYD